MAYKLTLIRSGYSFDELDRELLKLADFFGIFLLHDCLQELRITPDITQVGEDGFVRNIELKFTLEINSELIEEILDCRNNADPLLQSPDFESPEMFFRRLGLVQRELSLRLAARLRQDPVMISIYIGDRLHRLADQIERAFP